MSLNWGLVDFMVDNHLSIMGFPVQGRLQDAFVVYSMFMQNFLWKEAEFTETYADFCRCLSEISDACGGCIQVEQAGHEHTFSDIISYLDVDSLKILQKVHYDQAIKLSMKCSSRGIVKKDPRLLEGKETQKQIAVKATTTTTTTTTTAEKHALYGKLLKVLDQSENISPNAQYLKHLNDLLSKELGSTQLSKERAKLNTERAPFIPLCSNSEHISLLSTVVNTSNNKIVSLQNDKLKRLEFDYPGIVECSATHIHFIPNLKPQTDLTLGDCSYLDTCHKLNSCRYVHYFQYYPDSLLKQKRKQEQNQNQNQNQNKTKTQSFYTQGECCSSYFKQIVPAQWIKCDVRKFDFNILGKFSAVIADPAWNIHMNLPYGTCNDNELLQLPFDILQDEGLLFLWVTGRAIEVGKESLQNWSYEVVNEISWIKTNQLGRTIVTGRTGHWLNHSKEHLLVGVKGNPAWLNKKIDIDLIVSATRETSRKPDELYGIIERLVGTHARKLEIFGRDHNIRPGWFTIGNQVTGSCIHEVDVKRKYKAAFPDQNRL